MLRSCRVIATGKLEQRPPLPHFYPMQMSKIEAYLRRRSFGGGRTREQKVRKGFWRTFGRAAGRLPIAEDVVASYYCALDPNTPRRVRTMLLAALAYFVLPADAIPDILLGIGFSDDIAVLTSVIATIRVHVRPAHFVAARSALARLCADDRDAAGNEFDPA